MRAQQVDLEEAHIVPGDVDPPRSGQMNKRRGSGCQRAVPHVDKVAAALVTLLGSSEHFFRLPVQEPQAHGAIAHDAFQVAYAAASAVALLGVERDGDVATLPHALDVWPAAIADAVADG